MCIYIYIYVYVHIYIYIYVNMYMYVCMYIYIYINMYKGCQLARRAAARAGRHETGKRAPNMII